MTGVLSDRPTALYPVRHTSTNGNCTIVAYPAGGDPPDSAPIRVLERVSGVEIEVESLVPLGETAPVYFWGRGDRLGALERALDEDPTVDGLQTVEQVAGERLYRVDWEIDDPLIGCLNRADGALLDAHGVGTEWKLTV